MAIVSGKWITRLAALSILVLLAGCGIFGSSDNYYDRYYAQGQPETYTVRKGDTLYSIAFRYETDYRELAQLNNIPPPYTIYPGQRIQVDRYDPNYSARSEPPNRGRDYEELTRVAKPLKTSEQGDAAEAGAAAQEEAVIAAAPPPSSVRVSREQPSQSSSTRAEDPEQYKLTLPAPPEQQPGSAAAKPKEPTVAQPTPATQPASQGPTPRSVSAEPPIQVAKAETPTPSAPPKIIIEPVKKSSRGWSWPARGKILRTYAPGSGRNGIDVAGKLGQPVLAAADGEVVYRGSGLKGYGQLLIIKHGERYLSAYGFNQQLLVKQGDQVKAGQHIAFMGLGPKNQPGLHFEIRRNGRPVDPLSLLPKD